MSGCVVFDLDGTLVDSVPDILAAANRLLEELNRSAISRATAVSFVGNGIPVFVRRLLEHAGLDLPPERISLAIERFTAIYRQNPATHGRPYPGVPAALEELRQRGFHLGVCTNKVRVLADMVLDRLDLTRHFLTVVGGDDLPHAKPDPAMLYACIADLPPGPCLFVGDSEVDAATARAAPVPFILFTQGYLKGPLPAPPDAHFDDYARLPGIVRRLTSSRADG